MTTSTPRGTLVAIEGDRALVGLTGTYCDPSGTPKCTTNTDPAAILSSGRSFDTLYPQAVQAGSSNSTSTAYSLAPCQRVDSHWYIYVPPSTFAGH